MIICFVCGELFIPSKFHPNHQKCCYKDACRRERDRRIQVVYRKRDERRERENALQIKRRRLAINPLFALLLGALSVLFKQILHQAVPEGGADLYRFVNKANKAISRVLEMTVLRLKKVMVSGDFSAFTP